MTTEPSDKKKPRSEKRERQALIGFRATEKEVAEIDAAAERAGLTRSAFIRAQSLTAPKMRATTRQPVAAEVLTKILGQLGKCGSNLNQIAHGVNVGDQPTRAALTTALADLRAVFVVIQEAHQK